MEPRAAANLDTARCALTFRSPDDLRYCYDLCNGSGSGGSRVLSLLRTKNNFRDDYPAKEESFGYRSILANYCLELPQCTWGDLFDAELALVRTYACPYARTHAHPCERTNALLLACGGMGHGTAPPGTARHGTA